MALTLSLFITLVSGFWWFVFGTQLGAAAQHGGGPPHLSVQLQCPKYPVSGRSPITLYADILGTDDPEILKPITFKWRVSGGELVSGQGTRSIVLDVLKNESTPVTEVKVRLEADGGPPSMVFENSCNLRVDSNCEVAPIIDQYSSISTAKEHEHLDRLAASLKQGLPNSTAYIIAYGGKRSCIYEASWRAERAREYLVKTHHLPGERVIAVDGGFRESWAIDLFVQPTDGCGPLPSPVLKRSQVHIQGQCANQ